MEKQKIREEITETLTGFAVKPLRIFEGGGGKKRSIQKMLVILEAFFFKFEKLF